MKTIQRLSDESALRRFGLTTKREITISEIETSGWSITNGTIVFVGDGYYASDFYVMNVYPSSAGEVVVSLSINDFLNEFDTEENFVLRVWRIVIRIFL